MSHKADNRPIGVFDSGLGGLTVAAALSRFLPDEDIIYLGDTARVPYGDKSVDSIRKFALQDAEFLLSKGVKMIVIACNTVSAVAMDSLRNRFPGVHILGVLEAGVQAVIRSGAEKLTVIGTRATVNSDAYRRGIHAVDPGIIVESIACPLLVPMAEEGLTDGPLVHSVFDIYLHNVKRNPPDALLLGCTHYPLFKSAFMQYFEEKVRIIDSAEVCADHVAQYLKNGNLSASPGKGGKSCFFVTDMHSEFPVHAARFLNRMPERVEKITLPAEI